MLGLSLFAAGGASAEEFDVEIAAFEVEAVEVGDLQFTAFRGLEAAGEGDDIGVVKVDAGYGVVGLGLRGFFFEGNNAAVGGEFDDAVALRVCDMITENGRAGGAAAGALQGLHEVVAVEEIVAEDEGGGLVLEESNVARDVEGLRETVGAGLFGVAKRDAEL